MASERLELGAGVLFYAIGTLALAWSLLAEPFPPVTFVGVAVALFLGTVLIGVSRDRRAF